MAPVATSEGIAGSGCFLCQQVSQKVIWREDGIEGLLCGCGMVYTNQSGPAPPPDLAREFHADHFYALPAVFKAEWTARHCPPGRLLEVGCGAGFYLDAARSHGYEVSGLEPLTAYDNTLKQKGLNVVHEFVEENTLPKHSFDVVYHCDLLAHFLDPIQSLAAMSELLKPAGVLCFEVGLLGGISRSWYPLVGRLGLGQHLWLYSEQAFKTLMRRAGLEIVHIQYFGLAPEVIGGKVGGVFHKRVLGPALQTISADGKDRALKSQRSWTNFLRYRVGSLVPHFGPQTLLVVARPAPRH